MVEKQWVTPFTAFFLSCCCYHRPRILTFFLACHQPLGGHCPIIVCSTKDRHAEEPPTCCCPPTVMSSLQLKRKSMPLPTQLKTELKRVRVCMYLMYLCVWVCVGGVNQLSSTQWRSRPDFSFFVFLFFFSVRGRAWIFHQTPPHLIFFYWPAAGGCNSFKKVYQQPHELCIISLSFHGYSWGLSDGYIKQQSKPSIWKYI